MEVRAMRRMSLMAGWIVLLTVLGCRPPTHEPVTTVTRSPEFSLDSLRAVAYLGMASSVPDPRAVPLMEPAVQRRLLAADLPFVILRLDEVDRRVRSLGATETHRAVCDYWRDAKKLDKFKAAELCRVLAVDAILIGTVVDWLEVDAAASAQNASSTKVIASLSLFPAGAGRSAWQAQVTHTVEMQETSRAAEATYTERLQRERERRSPALQGREERGETPEPEDVVESVAAALVAALKP
jgi:hypothetical protein